MARNIKQEQEFLTKEFGGFVGKKLVKIRPLADSEVKEMYWDESYGDVPMVFIFENGTALIPSRDPEGNGPGFCFTAEVGPVPKKKGVAA